MYHDKRKMFDSLPDEQAAALIRAIFAYECDGGALPTDPIVLGLLSAFTPTLDHNRENYIKMCEKNNSIAQKGGLASAEKRRKPAPTQSNPEQPMATTVVEIPTQSNHNGSSGNPEQPRATQPQHDTDTDLDLDTELELEPVTENQKPCPSQNSMGERFEQFWKAYPKKKSKGDAEKAFKTIKPDGELLERILSAIESQKLTEQWQRDGGQFIPYPATWLRAKDWENEEFEEFEVEYAETLHYPEERPKIGGGMTWQDLDI